MTGTVAEIKQARAEALLARKRLDETLARLKLRLDPRVRVQEGWEDLRDHGREIGDDALEFAYDRPQVAAAGVAAGILLLLRRPIWRLLRWTFRLIWPAPRPKPEPKLIKNPTRRRISLAAKGGETR